MKKKLFSTIMLFFISILLVISGCSASVKEFSIRNADHIVLVSGNTGRSVEITDGETIDKVTGNITEQSFKQGKSSKDQSGWSYRLTWYNSEDKEIEKIIVMTDSNINYLSFVQTNE